MRRLSRLGLAVILGGAFTVFAVSPAHAEPPVATLTMNGEMHYDAALNQANHLTISNPSPGVVAFTDVYPITYSTPDGSTCSYPYATMTTVHCVHSSTFLDVKVYDLDDVIDNRSGSNMHASGGDGNDIIKMGGHAAVAAAGDAAGGEGDDIFYSGPGDDWLSGGNGTDTVTYQGRTAKIIATLVLPQHGGDPLTDEYGEPDRRRRERHPDGQRRRKRHRRRLVHHAVQPVPDRRRGVRTDGHPGTAAVHDLLR
jgi:hypothetical protein